MIDFTLGAELEALRDRVTEFIENRVVPREAEVAEIPQSLEEVRGQLQEQARAAGLFAPRVSPKFGGLGLDWRQSAVVFEAAGRSLLGPQALNCAAPDEGNMHLLAAVGTDEQVAKYLLPLAQGKVRSCFSMTEPAPGAGSDPKMLLSFATQQPAGDWIINGDKWFITGADGAAFTICMAQTDRGPTLFLFDTDNPGFVLKGLSNTLDHGFPGGHGEIELRDCRVPADAVLGEIGKGFEYAQLRLGPGRLTHCMRWLGIAHRSMEIAMDYVNSRESFGKLLAQHQEVQAQVADSFIEMHACRNMIWHAAWMLDQGGQALHETSMTKAYVAESVGRIVDRAIQMCGATGITDLTPLPLFYKEIRGFRIYDGPTEVHRSSVGIRLLRQRALSG